MIIMSNITKNHKMGIIAVVFASLFVGTLAISVIGHDNAFATHGKKNIHVKSNDADQAIAQPQRSSQNSQCITGLISAIDCNNIGLQLGLNTGNDALGQQ
jgi:hypothetical protein